MFAEQQYDESGSTCDEKQRQCDQHAPENRSYPFRHLPCPVRDQFNISGYPTLILLDETGRIVWRGDQGLDRQQLHLLETEIRKRLSQR